jgi:putative nucleotidyltransferase with HDIG domain
MVHNRFAQASKASRAYVAVVIIVGAATVLESAYRLWADSVPWDWTVLALLTLLSSSATVRLPNASATISISETFVFTSVLLFGPAAGTLTVALDALVTSGWSYRKGDPLYKIVFNVFALPFTIWIASHVFFWQADISPLFGGAALIDLRTTLWPLVTFTILYFLLNSWIIAFAIALEQHIKPVVVWRTHFIWLSINYFGGASVAWLLVSYTRHVDYTYLAVILPLLAVLYLTYYLSMRRVEDANQHLAQLNKLYLSTIETLAMAIDAKDQITHGHIRRVQTYAVALSKEVGVSEPEQIKAIEAAALLHDMGKLAVPEYILNKPGKLTPVEFEKMKLHASVGADILSAIAFPYPVVPIVRHHHENWNGKGYPDGLAGTDIPIGARILAVVDCYDALTSDRPYRPKLSDDEAIAILRERRGTMYDPLIVDTFSTLYRRIEVPAFTSGNLYSAITEAVGTNEILVNSPRGIEDIAASTGEMLTLFELARSLSLPMEISDLGDLIAKHLRRLIPCSLCAFFVYDEATDEIAVEHATGEHSDIIAGVRIAMGQRMSGWVAAHRHTIRNSDPSLDLGDAGKTLQPRPRSCLSTPLLVDGFLIGVISLYSTRADAFTSEHQRILELVSAQVAPAVQRSTFPRQPPGQLAELSHSELPDLTDISRALGLPDGKVLPHPTSLIVALIVDDNPDSGIGSHNALAIPAQFATPLRRALRAADLLFRLGPNEFGVLLLKTSSETCLAIADRIQSGGAASAGPDRGTRLTVTSATTRDEGLPLGSLIGLARSRRTSDPHFEPSHQNSSRDSIH